MEEQIISILKKASDVYYNTEDYYDMSEDEINCIVQFLHIPCQSVVTDAVYDAIYSRAKELYPNHPFFLSVGAEVRGDKVKLPIPMGSMVEAKIGDMQNWLVPGHYCISDKLDGISCLLAYVDGKLKIAYSRGDGFEGQDITRHIIKMNSCPKELTENFTGFVRGEIIIPKKHIDNCINELNKETHKVYKNGRNLCAGQLNAKDCAESFSKYAQFVAYYIDDWKLQTHEMFEELEHLGFITTKWRISNNILMTDDFLMATLKKVKLEGEYECDGIIITQDVIDDEHKGFETSSLNPKASRKFKISGLDETFTSVISGITWQISKDWLLKPVINIRPTEHNGVTISNISGNNYKFLIDNDYRMGSIIRCKRSGDVIPQVVEKIGMEFECGDAFNLQQFADDVEINGVELEYIGNDDKLIKEVYIQKLEYFCNKLGVEYAGYGNIKALFNFTETNITYEHFCLFDECAFEECIGVNGVKLFKSLHTNILNASPTQLADACGVFGRGIGELKLQKIVDNYGELPNDYTKVISTDGWAEKTTEQYISSYINYIDMVEFFERNGMWKGFETIKTSSKHSDVKVVFTGIRNADLERSIRLNGGKVLTSFTKECNLVIAKDPMSSSGKLNKARENGVEIISLEDAFERFGKVEEKTVPLEKLDNPLAKMLL